MSCAFANASTRMPGRLVIATPATTYRKPNCHFDQSADPCRKHNENEHYLNAFTALPILAVASLALSTRVGLMLSAKDLVMWDTNSTEMPTACKVV